MEKWPISEIFYVKIDEIQDFRLWPEIFVKLVVFPIWKNYEIKKKVVSNLELKVASLQKVRLVFQISKSPKKNFPKNYPELEI